MIVGVAVVRRVELAMSSVDGANGGEDVGDGVAVAAVVVVAVELPLLGCGGTCLLCAD